MKRISMLFTAVCFLTLFVAMPGCKTNESLTPEDVSSYATEEENASPLRVFIDVEYGSNIYLRLRDELANYKERYIDGEKVGISIQTVIEDMGGPSIELEIAPTRENERDIYLTSLRTEIMSGGGPDVFVCGCGIGYHMKEQNGHFINGEYVKSEPLFNYPQQAMKRNTFLALDDYIEKAQFMEWDRLTPVIMDAGRTEKGQLLLPMTYTVATTAFRKADVEHMLSKDMKWEDMLSGGPQMRLAAISEFNWPENGLAPLADYEHDKLDISEDEMARYINEKLDNREKYKEESNVPYDVFDFQVLNNDNWSMYYECFDEDEPIVLVPLYSRNGGYMATVTSFAGINVNTKRPDDAFFVVDYLLGEECQRSILYTFMTCAAVPTLEGLMTQGTGVSDGIEKAVMPDNFYEQFCLVRDNISFADFATPLDHELQRLFWDLLSPSQESTKSREDMIHDVYMRMSMDLAES